MSAPRLPGTNELAALRSAIGTAGMLVLGKRAIIQAAAELLLERDRFGLAGVFSAAAFLTTSDFDVEPVLRLRPGLASDLEAALGKVRRSLRSQSQTRRAEPSSAKRAKTCGLPRSPQHRGESGPRRPPRRDAAVGPGSAAASGMEILIGIAAIVLGIPSASRG